MRYLIPDGDPQYDPLSKDDETRLIAHAQAGCLMSRNRVVCANLLKIITGLKEHLPQYKVEDVIGLATMGMIHAISRYDMRRGTRISTLMMWDARSVIFRYYRMKQHDHDTFPSLDAPPPYSPSLSSDQEPWHNFVADPRSSDPHHALKAHTVQTLLRTLTPKQRRIMILRFGFEDGTEYTFREIAEKTDKHLNTITGLYKRAKKTLRVNFPDLIENE